MKPLLRHYRAARQHINKLYTAMNFRKTAPAWIAIIFGLAGCAVNPTDATDRAIESAAIAAAPYVDRFKLTARVSVRVADKLDVIKIVWSHQPPHEHLAIFTPFGSQIAEIVSNREGATLRRTDNDQAPLRADSVANLMASAVGVRVEPFALARWLQGFDLQSTWDTAVFPDASPRRTWQVEAENFRVIDGARVATRVTAISGDTVVRVVIDEFGVR